MQHFWQDKYTLGMWELQHDILFHKIPREQYTELIDFAWQCGKQAAEHFQSLYKELKPSAIAFERDIGICEKIAVTEVGRRVFSEYISSNGSIILYKANIMEELQKLRRQNMPAVSAYTSDYEVFSQLFIAHELYHDYEYREFGMTAAKKKIVVFSLWRWQRQAGLYALSEIAAHSFCQNLLKIA